MTKHHKAIKKHPSSHTPHKGASHVSAKSPTKILPLHSPAGEIEGMLPLVNFPVRAFEFMMSPLATWIENFRMAQNAQTEMTPKTENIETETEYAYKIPLPGIAREQITLKVHNNMLMLKAAALRDRQSKSHHLQSTQSILRALTLPVYTDGSAISARLKNGLLTIAIPKAEHPIAPKAGPIDIK